VISYRIATESDVAEIRDLQIDSWRRSYRGMLPDAFLRDEVVEVLGARWAGLPGEGWQVICGFQGARLAGFVSVDHLREGGAYVDNLHVADWAMRQGIGRELMVRAARGVVAAGINALWLTVINENLATRAFYSSIGGVEDPEQPHELYGQSIFVHAVRWENPSELAGLAAV